MKRISLILTTLSLCACGPQSMTAFTPRSAPPHYDLQPNHAGNSQQRLMSTLQQAIVDQEAADHAQDVMDEQYRLLHPQPVEKLDDVEEGDNPYDIPEDVGDGTPEHPYMIIEEPTITLPDGGGPQ